MEYLVMYVCSLYTIWIEKSGEVCIKYKNRFEDTGERNSLVVRQILRVWGTLEKPEGVTLWCNPQRENLKRFYRKVAPEVIIWEENLWINLQKAGFGYIVEEVKAIIKLPSAVILLPDGVELVFDHGFLDSINAKSEISYNRYSLLYEIWDQSTEI